ncbi:MAG TPA: histidine kinase [Chitinophagaceae bacterium]|nr:histidine kinase [Chitinophagaceae bacterium]
MRELLKKQSTLTKIEFWVITTIFVFVIFFFIINGLDGDTEPFEAAPYKPFFDEVNMPFTFYRNYFFPQLINHVAQFIFVLLMNFVLIPKLLSRKDLLRNIFFTLILFAIAGIIFGITGTYLKAYLYAGKDGQTEITQSIFQDGFENVIVITWVLIVYTAIKYAGFYLLTISAKIEARYQYIRKEAIVASGIWLAGLLFLRFGRAGQDVMIAWLILIPSAIALYLYSIYRLIPRSLAHKHYQFFFYIIKCAVTLFFTFLAIYLLSVFITDKDDAGLGYSLFNSFFQLFVTAPICWLLYKRQLKGNEQINVLQKELKRSSANIDFLRSQINPHFLFNALNTLYGTAIQENADKTSEGIQKLGDMMRFMLQENMQDKISLAREIDYLNNYISLQKLRTVNNPIVHIQTKIQDSENMFQIAPMLLIPFVENAFKHGISFREPSEIKLSLEIKAGTLYFDVYNSKHPRQDNDPEKDKSGIGLENVKQRLKLAYPNKHELIIRETTKEFFVHLTIQLAKFA